MRLQANITSALAIGFALISSGDVSGRTPEDEPTVVQRVAQPGDKSTKADDSRSEAQPLHHQANPPIDCPLRKQGVNPDELKPFDAVEEYIAFLERSDRAAWQKPDAVVEALHLDGTETIADVGAGSGYFSFRLAQAVPAGKVQAIDVEPEMIRHIHHKATRDGISNVEVVLATSDDPRVSREADVVFICDVLHHVQDRQAWLGKIHDAIAPGTRLVLIEFKEGELPEGPPESVKIPKREMVALVEQVGFELTEDHPQVLPYQQFLVFVKP